MRWEELFADLEAQLAAAEQAELTAEVADRTRREDALLGLGERLRPHLGSELRLSLPGAGAVAGRLVDVGVDWVLLAEPRGEALVRSAALLGVTGLSRRTASAEQVDEVARRLDLRWALRGLARSRSGVHLHLSDGSVLAGTLDRVGADHVDLAEHPPGEARRAAAVHQVRLVPLTALVLVRSWG